MQGAANAGADPSMLNSLKILARHNDRIDILIYLVEDCMMDINVLDDEDGDLVGRFGY